MLAMVRNDSLVHQAELKKRRKEKKKKWAAFPILRNAPARLLVRSLVRSLSFSSRSWLPWCHVQRILLCALSHTASWIWWWWHS
jgi:hypothetical protein